MLQTTGPSCLSWPEGGGGGGGEYSQKNDLTKNLIPYLRPDPQISTLFRTCFKIVSPVQTNVKDNVHWGRGRQGADGRRGT